MPSLGSFSFCMMLLAYLKNSKKMQCGVFFHFLGVLISVLKSSPNCVHSGTKRVGNPRSGVLTMEVVVLRLLAFQGRQHGS